VPSPVVHHPESEQTLAQGGATLSQEEADVDQIHCDGGGDRPGQDPQRGEAEPEEGEREHHQGGRQEYPGIHDGGRQAPPAQTLG
jgi:hypothetical protein